MSAIYEVLRQLDEWRHLPDYQLERRVDIFFGMFLPKVIEERFDVCVDEVIPEFPVHKGLFDKESSLERGPHRSVKVDFAVFGTKGDKKQIFLVELKTDMGSLDFVQLKNMVKARCAGPTCVMRGVGHLARNTLAKRKYAHLIWRLLGLECFQLKNKDSVEFTKVRLEESRPQLGPVFEKLCVGKEWHSACVDLVAVLPVELSKSDKKKMEDAEIADTDFKIVTFDQFAKFLKDGIQPFESSDASVFADYLRLWARVKAGRVSPWPQ